MKKEIQAEPRSKTPSNMTAAQQVMNPELLSASVITACHSLDNSQIAGYVTELKQQANAIHADDMSRPETILIAQAHALDGLFANLANRAYSVQLTARSVPDQSARGFEGCGRSKVGRGRRHTS